MASEEHLAILKKGVKAWNEWREKTEVWADPDLKRADLHEAQLSGANLYRVRLDGANLKWANLAQANLCYASLSGTNLSCADLSGANLSDAFLQDANLTEANLCEADLRRANLAKTNFARADLGGANLSGAIMSFTLLGTVELGGVEGLELVEHRGPSMLGIDTIYLSEGKIPQAFLRGAGVREGLITYMKSLVANPIEFYSCFISYSTANQDFAERLYADLQNKNVRCWFAPHDVQGGKKLHEQIDEAIRLHEKVLLILSADSMNSEWVKTELAKARRREVREQKQVLFPVRLVPFEAIRNWECFDADAGKDSAREIREYFIPDFSEWKDHDKYKKAFERLLVDLKGRATIGV